MTVKQLNNLDMLAAKHILELPRWDDGPLTQNGPCYRQDLPSGGVVTYDRPYHGKGFSAMLWEPTRDLNHCAEMDAVIWEKYRAFFYVERTNRMPSDGVEKLDKPWTAHYRGGAHPQAFAYAETQSLACVIAALRYVLGDQLFETVLRETGVELR